MNNPLDAYSRALNIPTISEIIGNSKWCREKTTTMKFTESETATFAENAKQRAEAKRLRKAKKNLENKNGR